MATRTVYRVNRVHGMDVCKDVADGAGRESVANSLLKTTREDCYGFALVVKTTDNKVVA